MRWFWDILKFEKRRPNNTQIITVRVRIRTVHFSGTNTFNKHTTLKTVYLLKYSDLTNEFKHWSVFHIYFFKYGFNELTLTGNSKEFLKH